MSRRQPRPKVFCRICQWRGRRRHRTGFLAGIGYGVCPVCLASLELEKPKQVAAIQVVGN